MMPLAIKRFRKQTGDL